MQGTEQAAHRLKQLYQGYVLEIRAIPVKTGGFTAHLSIMRDARTHIDDTPIHSGRVFLTAKEALDAGFQMAKQMIDGGFRPTVIVLNE